MHIDIRYINKWVAMANLARIPSVGCSVLQICRV
ncbi:MAG: hypothetical protein ACM65K_09390 [Microcoleus sp.]